MYRIIRIFHLWKWCSSSKICFLLYVGIKSEVTIPHPAIVYENNLPTVFGEGAENNFIYFLNLLINNQFPSAKIRNFYYFQIGRWDLELADNKIIKFPDSNIDEAIKKSIELLKREDFKNYNIIDLRVNGKIIVE